MVYVVGMEEGIFPGASAQYDQEELEEERRLCYVAMTRAKEKLTLTNCPAADAVRPYQRQPALTLSGGDSPGAPGTLRPELPGPGRQLGRHPVPHLGYGGYAREERSPYDQRPEPARPSAGTTAASPGL